MSLSDSDDSLDEEETLNLKMHAVLSSGTLHEVENVIQEYRDFKSIVQAIMFDVETVLYKFLQHVAKNPHVDVMTYVMNNGFGPGGRGDNGERLVSLVCTFTSTPDIITLLADQGYDMSSEEMMRHLLEGVSMNQAHPDVVKKVFDVIVVQSGQSALTLLEMDILTIFKYTFLECAFLYNKNPDVILHILDLYPDTAMRLEKYKEVKQKMEKGDLMELDADQRKLLLQRVDARIDEGAVIHVTPGGDTPSPPHGGDTPAVVTTPPSPPQRRWWILLIIILFVGGALILTAVVLLR